MTGCPCRTGTPCSSCKLGITWEAPFPWPPHEWKPGDMNIVLWQLNSMGRLPVITFCRSIVGDHFLWVNCRWSFSVGRFLVITFWAILPHTTYPDLKTCLSRTRHNGTKCCVKKQLRIELSIFQPVLVQISLKQNSFRSLNSYECPWFLLWAGQFELKRLRTKTIFHEAAQPLGITPTPPPDYRSMWSKLPASPVHTNYMSPYVTSLYISSL